QEDVRVARQGHAAVCHQRRVLVLGGVSEGTEFMNDCLDDTPGATLNNGTLVVGGGAALRRPSHDGEGGRGSATSFGYAEGGGGGGAALSRRPSSRASRHQSMEDDLWGWFGDDRPPSETALHAMARGDAAESAAGGGIGVNGSAAENAGVTVSTLALMERLAKLSAGRVLLDRVRADTRSLASVVTSAVHSAFLGEGVDAAAAAAAADVSGAAGTAEESCPATRAVHFEAGCSPPGGRRRLPGEEGGSEAKQTEEEEEEEEGKEGGEEVASSVDENGSSGSSGLGLAAAPEATGDDEKSGGQARGLRQRVVEARAEIEGLQREIRRLVRGVGEGGHAEETRARVAPLVERRAVLAQAARADAERMAKRLQEISEAQQSNHSNVDSAMREVERRARTAGGRVWALIRVQSRQHSSDDDDDDDDEGDESNDGLSPSTEGGGSAGAGGGGGGEATASTRTAGGGGGLFPSEHDGGGGGGGGGDAAAPEWVLSRLELTRMRRRGSFLDGDEVGPVRSATAAAEAAAVSAAAAAGEASTADSFGHLARLASVDGDGDRRDTDEAVSDLRDAMEQHSAALSRLARWMVNVAPPPSPPAGGSEAGLMAAAPMENHSAAVGVEAHGDLPSPSCPGLSGDSGFEVAGSSSEEDGVRVMLELSRESDVLESRVKRERFKAHRAADEEIHRTPEMYREACALGNALILKGHDYLSQALAEAGRDSAEASIMAEEASAWAGTVGELVDAEGLAAKGLALKAKVKDLRNSVLDQEDVVTDCEGALDKRRRRGAKADELEPLQVWDR
ncbi:unnamed protein product, partial [Ectocarpus sp. 13 AM-2016]